MGKIVRYLTTTYYNYVAWALWRLKSSPVDSPPKGLEMPKEFPCNDTFMITLKTWKLYIISLHVMESQMSILRFLFWTIKFVTNSTFSHHYLMNLNQGTNIFNQLWFLTFRHVWWSSTRVTLAMCLCYQSPGSHNDHLLMWNSCGTESGMVSS